MTLKPKRVLKQQRFCPGKGGRCRSFLSPLEDDPHPMCSRCRGKECNEDIVCDACAPLDDEARERWHGVLRRRRKRRKAAKEARIKEERHSSGGAKVGFSPSFSTPSGAENFSPSPIPPSGTVPSTVSVAVSVPVPVCVTLQTAPFLREAVWNLCLLWVRGVPLPQQG